MRYLNLRTLLSVSTGVDKIAAPDGVSAQETTVANTQTQIAFSVKDVIYLINGDGRGLERLPNTRLGCLRALKWSPDGKRIAFLAVGEQDMVVIERYDLAFHAMLYAMDASGENLRRVTSTPLFDFEWSPDSSKILLLSCYEDPRHRGSEGWMSTAVYVINVDGSDQKRLTPIKGYDSTPAWSPDGSKIAFSSDRDTRMDIYVMHADGTQPTRLTSSKFGASSPVWSPDGKEIAFAVNGPEMLSSMHLMASDGANERNVANNARPLEWSPDGKSLLIGDEIQLVDRDGRSRIKLAVDAIEALLLPEGKFVYFRSRADGQWDLFRVDINGHNRMQLTKDVGSVSSFSLSPATGPL